MTANTVNAIHETSGPTQLTIGAVATGTSLTRSGSTLVGVSKVNSDFGTYSAKGSPGPFDSLVINDFAAGGAVKVAFLQDIISSTDRSRAGIFRGAPVGTAHADNDEFSSGSSDLATRGWTVINAFTGATMTRAGDISFTTAGSSLSATQYRSTLTASGICIQCSAEMYAYKAVAVANYYVCGGVSGAATTTLYCTPLQIMNGALPITNSSIRAFVNIYNGTVSANYMNTGQSYSPNGWSGIADVNLDTFGMRVPALTGSISYSPTAGYSHIDRWIQMSAGSTIAPSGTLSYVGFAGSANVATNAFYTPFFFMRFFRRFSSTASIPLY
jgi:hypothetical protein